jgi:hypothetical protein
VLGPAVPVLAALALGTATLATASLAIAPALESKSAWWEKVTYTIADNGRPQACIYESSKATTGAQNCDEDDTTPTRQAASAPAGSYTKITIERRFHPGSEPGPIGLESGDILLGGKVMALAFDESGAVRECTVIAASGGDVTPSYGCREARAERFETARRGSSSQESKGFMTILVYGHEEVLA